MKALPLLCAACAVLVAACGGSSSSQPVPRRTAYPRIQTYDTVYTARELGSIVVPVNAQALASAPQPSWLNVEYPLYGLTVYMALVENLDSERYRSAIANRHQRLSLNMGQSTASVRQFRAGDFECMLIVSRDGTPTPVQFIAGDGKSRVFSGSAAFAGKPFPADSVQPLVDAVAHDMMHILLSLEKQ